MTNSAEVRTQLIDTLQLDLVGPTPDDIDHTEEILPQAPSLWYLTGFLVPYEASFQQRSDDAGDEAVPEAASARKAFFPSSMGLSFLVPQNTTKLDVTVQWGDYYPVPVDDEEDEKKAETGLQSRTSKPWQRTPRQVELKVSLRLSSKGKKGIHKLEIPDSGGLELVLTSRSVLSPNCLPSGTRSIAEQRTQAPTDSPQRARVAQSLLDRAAIANQRIEAGL